MRIYYDWEFLEDGKTILPISIGMVREDGEELYAVNDQLLRPKYPEPGNPYMRVARHEWLMQNVVPHLPLRAPKGVKTHAPVGSTVDGHGFFHLDPESPHVLPLRLIRAQVREFVTEVEEPELWAWYGAYDHVALAQLFGRMIDLPEGFPMFTNDIRTLKLLAGPQAGDPPVRVGTEHDALADAQHNVGLHAYYMDALLDRMAGFRLGLVEKGERATIPVMDLS